MSFCFWLEFAGFISILFSSVLLCVLPGEGRSTSHLRIEVYRGRHLQLSVTSHGRSFSPSLMDSRFCWWTDIWWLLWNIDGISDIKGAYWTSQGSFCCCSFCTSCCSNTSMYFINPSWLRSSGRSSIIWGEGLRWLQVDALLDGHTSSK